MTAFDRINDVEKTILQKYKPDAAWNGLNPGANLKQSRSNSVKFSFSDTSVKYDWYETALLLDVKILKADDTASGADEASLVPGNFSLIKSLFVKSGTNVLYKAENVAPLLFIRKALETGLAYSEVVGSIEGFTLDSAAMTADEGANPGFASRNFTGTKKLVVPLKNWGFFKALKGTLLPSVQLTIEAFFQEDSLTLFAKAGGATHKLIIEEVELRVPEVKLKAGREAELLSSVNSKSRFFFVEETITSEPQGKKLWVEVNLSDVLVRPLNIFMFTTETAKNVDRKYAFNTFATGGKAEKFIVKFGGATYFPDAFGYSSTDMERMYMDAISFANKQEKPDGTGVCFFFEEWEKNYGFIHFDMRKQTPLVAMDSKNLRVSSKFSGVMTNDYTIHIGTIYFVEAIITKEGGRTVIKKIS